MASKGNSTRYRAGAGAFTSTRQKRAALQDQFLRVLSSDAPEVWPDLLKRVRAVPEVWRDLLKRVGSHSRPRTLQTSIPTIPPPRDPLIDKLEGVVQEWAKAWNLDEDWIRQSAHTHLLAWRKLPGLKGVGGLYGSITGGTLPFTSPEGPSLPPYEPFWETKESYLRRINVLIQHHIDQAERPYRASKAFQRAPKSRDIEGLRWFIAYQVKGQSLTTIAREVGGIEDTTRNTVWKAITRLADDLPLTLRARGRKGRKKVATSP